MTHSAKDHQGILTTFPKPYWYLALKIKKCQVLHQPPPNQLSTQPSIKLDNTHLRNAEHVLYFGSLVSSNADFSSVANHGLCCANARAVVLPTCCSWATSWTTYSRHLKALEEHCGSAGRRDAPESLFGGSEHAQNHYHSNATHVSPDRPSTPRWRKLSEPLVGKRNTITSNQEHIPPGRCL